jgi:hypothetical protein
MPHVPNLNQSQTFRDNNSKPDSAIFLLRAPNRITQTGGTGAVNLLEIKIPPLAVRPGDVIEVNAILGKSDDAHNCDLNFRRITAAGSADLITQFRLTTALHQMNVKRFYRVENTTLVHIPVAYNTAAVAVTTATAINRTQGFTLQFQVQVANAAAVLTVDDLNVILHPADLRTIV